MLELNWQKWFDHGLNTLPNVQFGDLEVQFDDFPLQRPANLGFQAGNSNFHLRHFQFATLKA